MWHDKGGVVGGCVVGAMVLMMLSNLDLSGAFGGLILLAAIIGIPLLIIKADNKKGSENCKREYGADLYKPKDKWTAEDHANYKAKQIEKASQKGYNLMQQTRRGTLDMLKVEMAKNGIYDIKDVPAEYMSQWIRNHSNTLPTIEAFQEYANTLPANLRNELMSAVRNEAKYTGTECGSKNGGTDGLAIDKVQAIKEANGAKERLFAVMDKCDSYVANKGKEKVKIPEHTTPSYKDYNTSDNSMFD